ncbi:hypothetical protein [Paenibacillus nuruki]|uniref:hypothetical protein n=1 Tax=Paenibacillus nuruki TaxID=1886670 RepID=UPI0028048371|nr:hypothetical protein [Paenibacillus nuruki]CAJ1313580.1 Plug domain-containing protein [Paenibacillus nuruki]
MITLMMLLAGILSPYSGSAQVSDATPVQEVTTVQSADYEATPVFHTEVATPKLTASTAVYSTTDSVYDEQYSRLNGISLADTREDVLRIKGKPYHIVENELGDQEYQYQDVNIGFQDQWITYISVPAKVGTITLDGQKITLGRDEIRKALGKPDFSAEDGEGYTNGLSALKVFTDSQTGALRSVDIFDATSE